MKRILLKIDAVAMTILCLPGIIIGLPYLINQTRQNNKMIEQLNDYADNTEIGKKGEDQPKKPNRKKGTKKESI